MVITKREEGQALTNQIDAALEQSVKLQPDFLGNHCSFALNYAVEKAKESLIPTPTPVFSCVLESD